MVTKKLISLSLLLAASTTFIQCSVAQSGDAAFLKAKAEREARNPNTTTPITAAAAASTTSSTTVIVPALNAALAIGEPYPCVTIDPANQTETFRVGMTAADGHHKGALETSLVYVKRLARDKRLAAVLTDPVRTTQKTRERFSEGLLEGNATLAKIVTAQTLALKAFLEQQRSTSTTFSQAKKAANSALLSQQRTALHQATSDVDMILQIVHSMPDAKGSLSDACIREELDKLKTMQRQKEDDLKLQQTVEADILKQLIKSLQETSKQQENEFTAEINRIRQLRELLHGAHPAPTTLAPLSPRKTSDGSATPAGTTTTAKAATSPVAETKNKK